VCPVSHYPLLSEALTSSPADTTDITATTVPTQGGPPGFRASGAGGAPGISFDRFVRACVAIKQLTDAFQKLDTDRDGWIQINYDQFMHTVLQLP
jgi:hypothetical protein